MSFSISTLRADCPFCGLSIEKPRDLTTRRPKEMPVGVCSCGAVYAFDVTGHNLGAAFIEALVMAANFDWDLAWGLTPQDDYLERIVENYDEETNLIVPGGSLEGRRITGALYFIRMHDDIQMVTAQGVQERLTRANPTTAATTAETAKPEPDISRKHIEKLVRDYNIEPFLEHAGGRRKTLRHLSSLLSSSEELLRYRTAEILGVMARHGATKDPEAYANLLKQLLASPEDPGSFCPGALDAVGEIIAGAPDIYAGFLPMLIQYLGHDYLRPAVLRALSKIAQITPALITKQTALLPPLLQDEAPETRAYAAVLLGYLKVTEARNDLIHLQNDNCEVSYYSNGHMEKRTVGQLAATALAMI